MKKEDFRVAVRAALRKVSPDTRRDWDETELLIWWNKAQVEDSYLRWERAPGDVWQYVKSFCHDLIGVNLTY